ncbi:MULTISPECIES: CocE/NonD family hydrolase [unclassified Massilia]|uniref:CocE/NonD family hydrolase n=1 Tax=unclassified Massilia TaxID=2609279 RepID=UPI00177D1476|nr:MULTISPECIES: CocE/NonD family hydrolase [unclassified Massilia]MBD8529048.1 CocE/NonD family hydrolase [Massilia sp. CFBP 13647]MBD8672442.1 CocE/NonD family hydrolase [Massilia sp. CFBP 13721]
MRRPLSLLALSLALAFGPGASLAAQAAEADAPVARHNLRASYTKYEYRIPMRDGVKLFTVVYVPKDASRPYPFLMTRTPYSAGVEAQGELRYGVDWFPEHIGPSREFEDAGYIFVEQDVRGRYMSEGKWQEMTPHGQAKRAAGEGIESQDMHDSVAWLLKNVPNNNGKVGIHGISYPGFYTAASIIDSHPAIKAASPQAPVTDLYMGDDSYHGGAFMLAANFGFYAAFTEAQNPTPLPKTWAGFDYGTTSGYDFFLGHLTLSNIAASMSREQRALFMPNIEHDTYDSFWQSRAIAPHLKNIKAAVLTVGGWFDAEDPQGPFTTYGAIEKQNPGIVNSLVIGPWVHGGWARGEGARLGHVNFDSATAAWFRKKLQFPFFEQHLKGVKPAAPIAEVTAFETGSNVWRRYNAWPPQQAKSRTLYFGAGGKLAWTQPAAAGVAVMPAYDEYVADPLKPVPFIGYAATGMPKEYMVSDQRFAATRPDVLVYQSEVLEEDVTIAGPVTPKLFVSTTGTDADWVVKLIDVYPSAYPQTPVEHKGGEVAAPTVEMGGYQQLVRGNPLRGKFRHSFEQPEPFVPGKVEALSFAIGDVNHTFRRGHRIMVQVQSSWFPLVDLNPQTFMSIPQAKPEDFKKATQRVYRAPASASGVQVMVLPAN